LDYNDYGQCHECIDGYYMGKNTYTSMDTSHTVGGRLGTCIRCEVKNCEKCDSHF
jgi:hypothetical protein